MFRFWSKLSLSSFELENRYPSIIFSSLESESKKLTRGFPIKDRCVDSLLIHVDSGFVHINAYSYLAQ